MSLHPSIWMVFCTPSKTSPSRASATPFERSEDEIGAMLEDLLIRADRGGGTIVLLSHAPPKNTLDRIPDGNAGSDALARAIGKVDLIVCGHIHEDQGEMTI